MVPVIMALASERRWPTVAAMSTGRSNRPIACPFGWLSMVVHACETPGGLGKKKKRSNRCGDSTLQQKKKKKKKNMYVRPPPQKRPHRQRQTNEQESGHVFDTGLFTRTKHEDLDLICFTLSASSIQCSLPISTRCSSCSLSVSVQPTLMAFTLLVHTVSCMYQLIRSGVEEGPCPVAPLPCDDRVPTCRSLSSALFHLPAHVMEFSTWLHKKNHH